MPNRIIYQVEALYVGPTPCTGRQYVLVPPTGLVPSIVQLHRIQTANYGYSTTKRDVNQFGELAAIDRVSIDPPTVNLDFSYLNANFNNESGLGFYVNQTTSNANNLSAIRYILDKTQDSKNFWIQTVPEGYDANGYQNPGATWAPWYIGIGNGYISNFTTEGAVGDFPRTTVTVEGQNVLITTGIDILRHSGIPTMAGPQWFGQTGYFVPNPSVNPVDGTPINTPFAEALIPKGQSTTTGTNNLGGLNISVLRPGDITLSFYNAGAFGASTPTVQEEFLTKIADAKLNSYSLSFALSREPLNKLGTKFAFSKEITFPIVVSMRVDGAVGDYVTGNLADIISLNKNYDCVLSIKNPTGTMTQMMYILKNATLDNQTFSSSIGPSKTVSMTFNAQVGGPAQTTKGFFMSGVCV
jgi:hypothetical protein